MDYIVIDLEWNQSPNGKKYKNLKMPFEIIEIGAVKLNENFEEVDRFSELIKPKVYKNINYITHSIVHLKIDQLRTARYFPAVIRDFISWCGNDFIFCTWGNLDLTELQRNMKYHHIKSFTEGPLKFIDVQKLFSLETEGKKYQHTLEYGVDYYKIKKTIPFHRALADAYYTSLVLKKTSKEFLKFVSFDTFCIPKTKKDEIHVNFIKYYKYISSDFPNKIKAFKDKEVSYAGCYLCKLPVYKTIKWFTLNNKHYYCVSYCPKHGYIKGKIRLKKTEQGNLFIIKTMKQISENEMKEIKMKYLKHKHQT